MSMHLMTRLSLFRTFLLLAAVPFQSHATTFYAYIPNALSDNVSVINSTSNSIIATITVGDTPYGVAVKPDGSKVYITNKDADTVSVINSSTNTVSATISSFHEPVGIDVTPNGAKLYVANNDNNTVSVIDTASNTISSTINVGTNPVGLAVSPDGTKVYVVNPNSGNVSVISTSTDTVTKTITGIGSTPWHVAFTPDGSKAYVTKGSANAVAVITTSTDTVSGTISVGAEPRGVAVSPDGTKAYVTNRDADSVSVIATSSDTVSATVSVGDQPMGVSRLNRTASGKEDTFVLDFVNKADDILEAFKPYYEQTAVGDQADVSQLYQLQSKIGETQIIHANDIEEFCKIFFRPRANNTPADHATMNALLDGAVARFTALDDDEQEECRSLLTAFRNLYSFLSQVIPYSDSDLEKLYTYARFLLRKLPRPKTGPQYDFDDDVALKYYRLQKISDGRIMLTPGERGTVKGPTAIGTGANHEDEVELSRLIDVINDRFGTDFKPADELFFNQIKEEAVADQELRQAATANTEENFGYVFRKALEGLFIDRMEQNEELFAKYMNDPDFRKIVSEHLLTQVYGQIRSESPTS